MKKGFAFSLVLVTAIALVTATGSTANAEFLPPYDSPIYLTINK